MLQYFPRKEQILNHKKVTGYSHSMHNTHTKVLKKLGWEDLGRAALVCDAWREVGGIIDCSFVIKDETPAM